MFVTVNGARLFFDTIGPKLAIDDAGIHERPTLIVLHGGPGVDHTIMRPYFDRFADTHQVVYIDQRGNGRSSGAPETWTLAHWADDVKGFCDALGIEKPVVYGNSFGGFVAMSYGIRHPGHAAKLILSSTMARLRLDLTLAAMEARGGPRARAVAERYVSAPDEAAIKDFVDVCVPLFSARPDQAKALIPSHAIIRPELDKHFTEGELRTMDTRAGLATIHCPVLILAGALDPVTPAGCAREIAAALPQPELVVFDDAGHGVHRDSPARAEEVLRQFLRRGEP